MRRLRRRSHRAQFSQCSPETLRNSRSLFETRVSFRIEKEWHRWLSKLLSVLNLALGRAFEVFRYALERIDIARRPSLRRFEDHRIPFAPYEDDIAFEAELFRKTYRLTSSRPEDSGCLVFHDTYR